MPPEAPISTENKAQLSSNKEGPLLRIVYASVLARQPKEDLQKAVYDIVVLAGRFNRLNKITGCFCVNFDNRLVLQVFEGERKVVEELWGRIQRDVRHELFQGGFDISVPDKLISARWGMPLRKPKEMVDLLYKNGVECKNTLMSLIGFNTADLDKPQKEPGSQLEIRQQAQECLEESTKDTDNLDPGNLCLDGMQRSSSVESAEFIRIVDGVTSDKETYRQDLQDAKMLIGTTADLDLHASSKPGKENDELSRDRQRNSASSVLILPDTNTKRNASAGEKGAHAGGDEEEESFITRVFSIFAACMCWKKKDAVSPNDPEFGAV